MHGTENALAWPIWQRAVRVNHWHRWAGGELWWAKRPDH